MSVSQMTSQPVPSPCIRVCSIDPATGWCVGCGRSRAEIAGWNRMDDEAREGVLEAIGSRLLDSRPAGIAMDCATCRACAGRLAKSA